MKGEIITSCVVIKSTLEQLQEELLEKGRDLLLLLKVAYPDAKAVLAAIARIEFLLEDQPKVSATNGLPHVSKQMAVKDSSRTFLFVR